MVSLHQSFYVGTWLVQPALNRISQGNTVVALEPRVMHMLVFFAERSGDVIFRQELLDAFWPDLETNESALTRTIFDLRTALGDNARNAQYIETIRKRGYRLVAPVRWVATPSMGDGQSVDVPTVVVASQTTAIPSHRWLLAGAALMVGVFATMAMYGMLSPSSSQTVSMPQSIMQLTSLQGVEREPSLAPDGSAIAFVWDDDLKDGDNYNVFIKQIGASTAVQRTNTGYDDRYPVWSPDGKTLAFVRLTGRSCALFTMPAISGTEEKVSDCGSAYGDLPTLTWTADGKALIYADRSSHDQPYRLHHVDIQTGQVTVLIEAEDGKFGDYFPAASPDGRYLAFSRQHSYVQNATIFLMDLSSGAKRSLWSDISRLYGLSWSSDGLVVAAREGSRLGLWQVDVDGNEAPKWLGYDSAIYPSVSRETEAVAYLSARSDVNVWRVSNPILVDEAVAEPVIASTRWDASAHWSPRGNEIAFISNRTGYSELWKSDAQHTRPVQLTHFEGAVLWDPRWSPDGRRIVFTVNTDSTDALYVIDSAGGVPHLVHRQQVDLTAPTWSRAGDAIYFGSRFDGHMQIARLDLATKVVRQVTTAGGHRAVESFDGNYLYVAKGGEQRGLFRQPLAGGDEEPILMALYREDWRNWELRTEGIYFLCRGGKEGPTLQFYDNKQAKTQHLYTFPRHVSGNSGLSMSPDGSQLIFSQSDQTQSDIMLAIH